MRSVVETMVARGVFASVDVHNNTGLNPHYACTTELYQRFLHVVTVECGKPEHAHRVEHVLEFIDACLYLSEIPQHPLPVQDRDRAIDEAGSGVAAACCKRSWRGPERRLLCLRGIEPDVAAHSHTVYADAR
jgi:hypothetical protein